MENSGNVVSAKQQIVERIRQSTNILITVSGNPSVDALSAMLALTLMLNKLDKHATAVFSGAVPPAIKFLEPDKTFAQTVDSLRDFIIALDKDKADRLRYKVENDVVKIYITPYKYNLSEKDLRFSQGDLNVDMILALGVEKKEDLDRSVAAHGRILHDAVVMTVNAANQKSALGVVDWQDPLASSLSEMLVSVSESLQPGLLDPQISTALLTGIVAATERFSNQRTTPKVMTMAAQLMAAGANQQLIANNLRNITQPGGGSSGAASASKPAQNTPPPNQPGSKGEMVVKHNENTSAGNSSSPQQAKNTPPPSAAPRQTAGPEIQVPKAKSEPAISEVKSSRQDSEVREDKPAPSAISESHLSYTGPESPAPTFGGTLSATAQEALEDKLREEVDDRNKTILTHADIAPDSAKESDSMSFEVTSPPIGPEPVKPMEAPKAEDSLGLSLGQLPVAEIEPAQADQVPTTDISPPVTEPPTEQPPVYENQSEDIAAAREMVDQAYLVPPQPIAPGSEAVQMMVPPVPELPESRAQPAEAGLTQDYSSLPPLPDFSTLPPAAPDQIPTLPPIPEAPTANPYAAPQEQPPNAVDPHEYKIPGSA